METEARANAQRLATLEPLRHFVANKRLVIAGVHYGPGDPVDTSTLPDHKVAQFLNQRLLRPAVPVNETGGQ